MDEYCPDGGSLYCGVLDEDGFHGCPWDSVVKCEIIPWLPSQDRW